MELKPERLRLRLIERNEICFRSLSLHRLEAACTVNNIGSIKVLVKVRRIREEQRILSLYF